MLHRPFAIGLFGMACCIALMGRLAVEPLGALERSSACAEPAAPPSPSCPHLTTTAELPSEVRATCSERCVSQLQAVNVIDVAAAAATPELIAGLLRLESDERVTSVDEHLVGNDVAAGAWIAARFDRRGSMRRGDYIDVAIAGPWRGRRVLLLFH